MIETNRIYNENCLETMAKMPDNFIDLTVTSPPYDGLRTYNGYSFDFESIAKELFRTTKDGGVVVWVVGDATINGSETGTSFRQALFFMQCGFKLHDTMIYKKNGGGAVGSTKAYWQYFEYMFVFVKGNIKTYNLIKDKKNTSFGKVGLDIDKYSKDGEVRKRKKKAYNEYSVRSNVWDYTVGCFGNSDSTDHPAVFPEDLARDHIYSWSNEGDLVYDCFSGSGTTAKMAHLQNRKYVGSEISEEYHKMSIKRIQPYLQQKRLF